MVDSHVKSDILENTCMLGDLACQKAINENLEGITLVNTFDCTSDLKLNNWLINFDKYSSVLYQMKLKYHEKLFIYNGVNLYPDINNLEGFYKIVHLYNFDYIAIAMKKIAVLDNIETYYSNKNNIDNACNYIEDLITMIQTTRNFDVINNIIYIAKYYNIDKKDIHNSKYLDIVDDFLKNMISRYKGLEIDTTYLNKKIMGNDLVNNLLNLLKRYKDLGGELISVGSNSIKIDLIGYNFNIYKRYLIECGFKFTMHYTNRNPVYDRLYL